MLNTSIPKSTTVLVSASLVAAVLGSVHGFSVFLEPLEARFDASRTAVSLTYSMALVALTLAVLFGPQLYGRWSASRFMIVTCLIAACGVAGAGIAGSLSFVWLGYSLVFGAANGLGYGFGLQIAAQVSPGREGRAMGIVTAAYAFGAVMSPALFDLALNTRGFQTAMMALAGVLICVGLASAALMKSVDAQFREKISETSGARASRGSQLLLWFGYFGGVVAGLMIIGHAAAIASSLRPGMAVWTAPVIIAGCNLVGSLVAGRLTDRIPLGTVLASLALMTTVALLGLAFIGKTLGMLACLALVGFAYGGTIAAYPAAIAKLYGIDQSARIYGRVFTAWGSAGLVGPWFAGYLFDWSGDYQIAFFIAAAIGLGSLSVVSLLFRSSPAKVS